MHAAPICPELFSPSDPPICVVKHTLYGLTPPIRVVKPTLYVPEYPIRVVVQILLRPYRPNMAKEAPQIATTWPLYTGPLSPACSKMALEQ
jgi:hypothetical protein